MVNRAKGHRANGHRANGIKADVVAPFHQAALIFNVINTKDLNHQVSRL